MGGEKKTLQPGFVVGDSEIIHPALGNTEKDGAGDWHLIVVDDDGRAVMAAPGIESLLTQIHKVLQEIRRHQVLGI